MASEKQMQFGLGLDEACRGLTFQPGIPECHEHCGICMSAGCACPEHDAEWKSGFVCLTIDADELWICPKCFQLYGMRLDLKIEPES